MEDICHAVRLEPVVSLVLRCAVNRVASSRVCRHAASPPPDKTPKQEKIKDDVEMYFFFLPARKRARLARTNCSGPGYQYS